MSDITKEIDKYLKDMTFDEVIDSMREVKQYIIERLKEIDS